MTKPFKPLLSATITDTALLSYSVAVSTKLDGIRCLVIDGVAVSRNLKPIRNEYVQRCIGKPAYNGCDGELVVSDVFSPSCYRDTSSGIMSGDGEPDFTFHVFDRFDMDAPFSIRFAAIPDLPFIERVPHTIVSSEAELLKIEGELLAKGAEGVMVRSIDGAYKYGRSTLKDGILGKLKRFVDNEYKVIGSVERMRNENEATTDALGHTKRSTHQENKVGRGDLGALICVTEDGLEFNVGSGFDDAERAALWAIRENLPGRWLKVKSFAVGVKDLPRFPTALGFRDESDL